MPRGQLGHIYRKPGRPSKPVAKKAMASGTAIDANKQLGKRRAGVMEDILEGLEAAVASPEN